MWTRLVGQVVWLCGRTVLFLSNFRVNQYTFLIWWSTRLRGRSYEWHLTCVRGEKIKAKRRRVLELITQLGFSLQLPWLAVGD